MAGLLAPRPSQAQATAASNRAPAAPGERLAATDEGYPLPLAHEVKIDAHPLTEPQAALSRDFSRYGHLSFLLLTEQYEEAAKELGQDRTNREAWPADLALKEVRLTLEQGKTGDARMQCQAVIKAHPELVTSYMLLAEIEAAARNEDAVIAAMESARKAAPRNRMVLESLGRRYNLRMQRARTTDEVNAILDHLEDVYDDLVKVVQGRPAGPYLRLLAFIKEKRGRMDEARECLEALIRVQPREASNFADLAKTLMALDRKDEALGILRRGIVVDPNNVDLLAVVAAMFGDAAAAQASEEAASRRPADKPRDVGHIVDFYGSIAQEYPGRDDLQIRYARLLLAADQLDAAVAVLEASHAFHPQSPEVQVTLALALYHCGAQKWEGGDQPEGEKLMRRAIGLDPANAEIYNSLGYLLGESGQRLDEARTLVEKANDLKPGQSHILDSVGWVHYKMGDYENGLVYLKQSVAIDGNDPVVQEHLGRCYLAAGRKDEGVQCLKAALVILEKDASPENAGRRQDMQALIHKME